MLGIIFLLIAVNNFACGLKTFKLGVPLISSAGTPYDIERVGPAIILAVEKVNREILNSSYEIQIIEKPYGTVCSGSTAPGMHTLYKYSK